MWEETDMKSRQQNKAGKTAAGLTRRSFVAAAGAAGTLAITGRGVFAAEAENVIRVGFISPRTGPLAGFGEGDGYVLDVSRKALEKGLTIGEKTYKVEIVDRDTQSDPARAGQLAKSLINSDNVDLMLTTSTPETVNPVSDAAEAAGVPCLSTVMPWQAWYFGRGAKPGEPSPFKWSYHFSFGGDQFIGCYITQWGLIETNKKVGVMYPNDADGNAIRSFLPPELEKAGYTIIDPGPYEDGTTDYAAQIALFKKEKCEILNTFPIPPDFAAFWRQAAQLGWTKQVKIAQVAKTGLFPSGVESLGNLGYNLGSACYWHRNFPYKSPLTGLDGPGLCDGYEAATGKQWQQQLGASLSLVDGGIATLKTSTDPKDKAATAKAMSALQVEVMTGPIDFTKGPVPNVSPTPIVGTQWIKAPKGSKYKLDYVITENTNDKNVPVGAKLLPYNS
jgi:branched-chain amino acid transport system substrate-binding protein